MFAIEGIIKYEEFTKYWFVPLSVNTVAVVDKLGQSDDWKNNIVCSASVINDSTANKMHTLDLDTMTLIDHSSFGSVQAIDTVTLLADWEKYKQRPEWEMISLANTISDIDAYEVQLAGAVLIKEFKVSSKNPDRCHNKLTRCFEWLRKTDFYTCPASTQYHDSFTGGLLKHSLNVCDSAVNLLAAEPFKSTVYIEDAVLVSLIHDWCKIGLYVPYKRNVKDEATGQWNAVDAFRYAENRTICLGHGVSSMYMASKFFNLNMEESLAVRWHMGKWNVADSEINELQQANRMYPLVHLIQFADQLAITDYR